MQTIGDLDDDDDYLDNDDDYLDDNDDDNDENNLDDNDDVFSSFTCTTGDLQ